MDNGWVKIHRKIHDWRWYQNSEMVHLFLHFLTLANHKKSDWQGEVIEKGQFITGLEKLSKDTGISQQTLRTCIARLKSTGEITNKSTNKYRLITITKYGDYQIADDLSTSKSTSKSTNNQQTTNKQLTANKKVKKEKNDKNLLPTTASGGGDIVKIIDSFKVINPSYRRWFGRPPQRAAAERLAKQHGLERILHIVNNVLPKSNSMAYAPTITTPMQLEEKYAQLKSFLEKERSKKPLYINLNNL